MADKTFSRKVDDMSVGQETKAKIKEELDRLSKTSSPDAIQEFVRRNRKNEDLVDAVLDLWYERSDKIKKWAKKMAKKALDQSVTQKVPYRRLLEKMLYYKNKYKLSDAEYDEFQKELRSQLQGYKFHEFEKNQFMQPFRSRIGRALGVPYTVQSDLGIKDTEHPVLAEILSMYEKTHALHRNVFLNGLMYKDMAQQAISGEFRREKHIAMNHIWAGLVCLLLPKFQLVELMMLYSNFGCIVKCRHDKRPIATEPDALLFDAIIHDPNDAVCDIPSAITDLRDRYRVQIALWKIALLVRDGKYYEGESMSEFVTLLNKCRNNLYDYADLIYGSDDLTLFRRLLNVFSFRPTMISVRNISAMSAFGFGMAGLSHGIMPFQGTPAATVTFVPMLTMYLPYRVGSESNGIEESKDLQSVVNQTIWITDKHTILPKEQTLIFSRELLIIGVNRRVQRIQLKTYSNPISFSQLPLTQASFEKLNKYPVNVPGTITNSISSESYDLRSVIALTETPIKESTGWSHIITGSVGLIMCHQDQFGMPDQKAYIYDPYGASLPFSTEEESKGCDGEPKMIRGYSTNKPVSEIEAVHNLPTADGYEVESLISRASTSGTVFIYAKSKGYDRHEIIHLI